MTELAQTICSSLGKPVPSKKDPGKRPDPEEKPAPAGNISPPMTPPGKSPKPVMIGVIAAAAVLAVIIGIVLSGKGRETGQGTTAAVDAAQEADTVPSETAPEGASGQDPSLRDGSAMTFGVWKKIAYEDRGAATDVHTDALYILGDGTPYFSLEDSLSGPSRSALTPDLLLEDSGSYDLTVETSFEDTFDGSISDSHGISITSTFAYSGLDIDSDPINPDENPTGLTYSDCYPDQYYFVHLTGTFRESPVKESDVDTWLVYKKQYPLFSSQIYPALVGRWKDSFGNIWEFSMEEEDLAFRMTDTDGNTYAGKECSHRSANEDKVNFFERVQFIFETYKTDFYAVVSFDGQKLEMLDQNWDSFVLTKEP